MSRPADKDSKGITIRVPIELSDSINRNYKALGASSKNQLIVDAIRFYLDNKSDEVGSRKHFTGMMDQKFSIRLETHLGNTNNEIRGTTWYLTLLFVSIIWFAEQFFKLMQIQMLMINDLRFQTSPKPTEEALSDRDVFEQQIRTFTAFKKPDVIAHQIAESPKLYVPVRDRLSTLHKEHIKSTESKTSPKPQT